MRERNSCSKGPMHVLLLIEAALQPDIVRRCLAALGISTWMRAYAASVSRSRGVRLDVRHGTFREEEHACHGGLVASQARQLMFDGAEGIYIRVRRASNSCRKRQVTRRGFRARIDVSHRRESCRMAANAPLTSWTAAWCVSSLIHVSVFLDLTFACLQGDLGGDGWIRNVLEPSFVESVSVHWSPFEDGSQRRIMNICCSSLLRWFVCVRVGWIDAVFRIYLDLNSNNCWPYTCRYVRNTFMHVLCVRACIGTYLMDQCCIVHVFGS